MRVTDAYNNQVYPTPGYGENSGNTWLLHLCCDADQRTKSTHHREWAEHLHVHPN